MIDFSINNDFFNASLRCLFKVLENVSPEPNFGGGGEAGRSLRNVNFIGRQREIGAVEPIIVFECDIVVSSQ